MDRFTEQVVIKHNRMLNEVLYVAALIMMVFSGIVAFFLLQMIFFAFDWGTLIFLVLEAGIAAGLFFYRDRLRTEYEYTFTNGSLDFAMVFNNKKRKSLGSLNVRTVDAFGPVNGQGFKRYMSMPGVKTSNWFLNRGSELYFFYFQKEGNKRIIVLEPNEEIVEYIRAYIPQSTYQA